MTNNLPPNNKKKRFLLLAIGVGLVGIIIGTITLLSNISDLLPSP